VPASLPSLRLVMVGGEALPGDALRRWQAGPLAHVRLDNLYGPTETTVTSCLHPTALADADSLFVAIGRGFPGRSLVIVDGDGNPSPTGELCIGGASVGRGYLGRPGLTAERFVPNPFGRGRLYRTGDLCRRRIDGTIEFLGRLDNQVKLRGYRIELGEVEAALRACDGVKAAAAAIRERRLVGYAVGEADPETLKAALAARLPDYLVPSVVVMLDALPLLPNGKTDAAALPEPAVEERELVGSRNGREATLLSIWRGVLKRDDIGVTENFFALGGDSILSLQVVARARQAQLKLTPKQLFEQPTIAALAAVASEMTQSVVAITDFAAPSAAALGLDPAEIEEIYPATPLQQGLIYHSLLAAGDGVYVNQLRLTLRAPLDVAALRAAWGEALDRHAVLRTGFDWRHGGDTLQVVRRRLDLPWGEHDWSDRHTYEIDLAAWREADVAAGFDLAAPPLFRLALFHRPDGDADLIWTHHHALTDGWSG
ncbi:MAG: condensation domain-containing protein, partial [Ferrovibrionaceae bacterium]